MPDPKHDPRSNDVDFLANPRIRVYLARLPLVLDGDDEEHVLVFRRTLEIAMSQGRWAGQTGWPS